MNQQASCTVIRLVNESTVGIDTVFVNTDAVGPLQPGETLDWIRDPLRQGIRVAAFTGGEWEEFGELSRPKVKWHIAVPGPLTSCKGYVVSFEPGGMWRIGQTFEKVCAPVAQ